VEKDGKATIISPTGGKGEEGKGKGGRTEVLSLVRVETIWREKKKGQLDSFISSAWVKRGKGKPGRFLSE